MSQDYIALEWVKGEIEETLQQAQQALEAYVENPQDKSRLKFCLSYLHQIHGTLQMVEFYGAALLAEEMEAVASALSSAALKNEREGLEILMQAIIQLPHYLEHVKVGRRDLPVVLLPILNELRSARGEAFLSETSLFAPVIRHNAPLSPQQAQAVGSADFAQWARKVRQMLQTATLQLLQNKQPDVAKQYLNKAFARLHKTLGHTPQGIVWLPALAFSEWLQKQQHLPSSAKQLLRQLDHLLKATIEEGVAAINQPAPAELLKNLLFYVARTDAQGEAIRQVQEQFGLRQALPSEEEIEQERHALAGPDRATVGHVLGALVEEIAALKDRFDLLVRSDDNRIDALRDLTGSMKQIGDTMGMLGLGMPRKVMQEQQSTVEQMLANGQATDEALLDVAGALLYIEATLSGMQREGDLTMKVGQSALSDAQKAVLREARNVLEQVKDSVVAYIANQWAVAELQDVPGQLHSIEGSLNMIPLPRVAAVLRHAAAFVQQQLIDAGLKPQWSVLDTFADVLSGVEYFLERYSENPRSAGDDLLQRSERALGDLPLTAPLPAAPADVVAEEISLDGDEHLGLPLAGEFDAAAGPDEEEVMLTAAVPEPAAMPEDGPEDEPEAAPEAEPETASETGSGQVSDAAPAPAVEPAAAADDDDDLIDDEIIEIFLEEADEVTETLNEYWPQFKADQDDKEAMTTVRRAFHTLKGSGRMVKAMTIGELAWSIENMFNRVLDNTIVITPELMGLVDHVITLLPGLIDDFRNQRPAGVNTQPLMDYAFALAAGEAVGPLSDITGALPSAAADDAETATADNLSDEADEDDSLLDIFEGEARSHLQTLDEFVQASREQDYLNSLSDNLQRALHTLKGSAHMAGIGAIAEVASPLEKFVKELRAYQVNNSAEVVDVLASGAQLIGSALGDRVAMQAQSLQGSADYLTDLMELEHELLAHVQAGAEERRGPNPQAISRFLAQGMDSLLDADELLQQWQQQQDPSVLQGLRRDLQDVAAGAAEAEVPHIQLLAEVLNELYQRIEDEQASPEEGLLALASDAHEEMLTLMDCLAAGQETQRPEALLERLRTWEFIDAAAPEADDHTTLADAFNAGDDAEEIDFSAFDLAAEDTAAEDTAAGTEVIPADDWAADELTLEAEPAAVPDWLSDDNAAPETEELTAEDALAEDVLAEDVLAEDITLAESPAAADDDSIDDEILEIFLEEAQEIGESVETALLRWRENPDDLLQVAQLQRELHTLKGGARMAEIAAVADLCHELETLYENVSDGRLSTEPALFELLDRAHDELGVQLDAVRGGQVPEPADAMMAEIRGFLRGQAYAEVPDYVDDESATETVPAVSAAIHTETLDESDREILEIFLEEAHELQEALDRALHDWEQEPDERAGPEEAQRVLHTLKGGARLAGLSRIGDLAHDFETHILHAQQGQINRDAAFFQGAYQRQDELMQEVDQVAAALQGDGLVVLGEASLILAPQPPADVPSAVEADEPQEQEPEQEQPVAGTNVVPLRPAAAATSPVAVADKPQQPQPQAQQKVQQQTRNKAPQELVKVSADLLDSLVNLAGETSIGRGRLEQQVTDFAHTLDEMDMTLDRLRDQLRRLDMETEAQVLFRQERHGPEYEDFDPLEMDRYSTIQQLSRALVESASDLLDLKETLSHKTRDAETLLLQQSRVNTELQEGLMKTRMVPFQRLVPRLRRIVRQVSLELDKQVELRVYNADGEMDRTILERMISPLEHMVRNAVDHGIETREQRASAGKPDVGSIDLEISRDGGDVLITMTDDGRGINLAAVRKKAIERGLMNDENELPDQEVLQFILQAGFSTAEAITQISGRGVGMDVVASEIKQMGGSVEIQSEAGVGTRFIVRLPFTVSVNRALMVKVGDDLYAVPLNNIQGIVRVPVNQMQALYEQPQAERKYHYASTDYRIEYLGVMLENEASPKFSAQTMPLPVLLVRGTTPFALQVDSLLGSREIVVKTLGPQFAGVMGVSGGTILGDGSVVIILDLPAMIRTQSSLEYQQAKLLDHQEAERRHELESRLPRILVVDDSVTVRKVTTRLLERNGMEVFTAKDGVDAMATLQDHKPDLMLLDIEMPRMDGFEVASLVRHDSRLKDIPIIMITSRTGDKHRERAMSIGVNEYLGKPFQEDILLGTMNRLLGRGEH
ncbi:Hpt domain-containing protein [Venatoribacter cucullus]|uniref:Hpt domain-containing protein n=1 Tax=Venatoribacter cucullus TaxID=2661630 RepID=UPI002240B668|nr:Hpt domain-containing protein [Venatoribacter cucullus]UZK04567.1 response regulator [Venatoribacter cucullus]